MAEMIGRILDVKSIREDRAQTAVKKCQMHLAETNALIERRNKELADYTAWRIAEEKRMWDEIEQKLIHIQDLDDLKAEIGLMRGKTELYREKIRQAVKQRDEAREALDKAEADLAAAIKARQKFEMISDILDEEERAELARRDEVELEDLMRPMSVEL